MKRKLLSDNPNEVVRILFRKFGLKYDRITEQKHKAHPRYPGFASIAYILSHYGIDSCLLETSDKELTLLPLPFIIEYDGLLLPITEISDATISILNEKEGVDQLDRTLLDRFWSKTALVFDSENIVRRKSSALDTVRYYFNKTMWRVAVLAIASVIIYLFIQKSFSFGWINYTFLSTGIAGLAIGFLFQIQEFNRNNRFVNRICHSRRQHGKRDCSSILDSQDARFMGLFSWVDFGFLYFLFLVVLPLFVPANTAISTTMLFSLPATLYIPYSLFYQWRIARRWCALCLLTQGVLFLNFMLSLTILSIDPGYLFFALNLEEILKVITIGIITMALLASVKMLLKNYRNRRIAAKYFVALKHDYSIKNDLFQRQQQISSNGIEKIVLNPSGNTVLTVILNPVCNPCMRKMKQLLEIYDRKRDTRIELILLLDKNDPVSQHLARYFLACYFQDKERFTTFLDDYVRHFPASSHRNIGTIRDERAAEIISAHDKWCAENGITSTPRMYLDGREIPDIYDMTDIDYMTN